jgi:hypothetical protein
VKILNRGGYKCVLVYDNEPKIEEKLRKLLDKYRNSVGSWGTNYIWSESVLFVIWEEVWGNPSFSKQFDKRFCLDLVKGA